MTQRETTRRRLSRWGLVIVALGLVIAGVVIWLPSPKAKPTRRLVLTAGNAVGARDELADRLAAQAIKAQVQIEVQATTGSAKAIESLRAGDIDLALVQGGLQVPDSDRLRQVAVLNVEPLHLLVKPKVAASDAGTFQRLKGCRINVSKPGSGTNLLALEVLRFAGLQPDTDFEPCQLSYEQLMAAEASFDELPDAVFTVSMLPSPVATQLIQKHGYVLVPMPFSGAFRLQPEPAGGSTSARTVSHRRVLATSIPAYTYGLDPAAPEADVPTIGYPLQLLANSRVSVEEADRIASIVYDSPIARATEPPLKRERLSSDHEFPIHPGAQQYLDRQAPFDRGKFVEVTEQLVGIAAAVIGSLLFFWQWLSSTRRKGRDRDFLARIKRVIEIENVAEEFESNDDLSVGQLLDLQKELRSMRSDMVEDFQSGRIDSIELFSASLKHVSDASEQLMRVILHELPAQTASGGATAQAAMDSDQSPG